MTWAIGACNVLGGHAAMVSDVQVTFSDGRTADLCRKAYPVGPYLVGAFAGSVRIGFHLLQSIADHLEVPPGTPANACYAPAIVAEHWAPIARAVFEESPAGEQALGAQFLLVGPHPTEDGFPGTAIPYLCKLTWPDFGPEIVRNGNSALSIGSGADVPIYLAGIQELLDPRNGLLHAEIVGRENWTQTFGFAVNHMLRRHQVAGISHYVHVHRAFRGGFNVGNSDSTEHPSDGPRREYRMPPVAENYEQFVEMAQRLNANAATAIC